MQNYLNYLFQRITVNKKGVFFFVVDVFIAVLLLFVTVVVIFSFFTPSNSIGGTNQYLQVLQQDLFFQNVSGSPDVPLAIANDQKYASLQMHQLLYVLYENGQNETVEEIFEEITLRIPNSVGIEFSVEDYEPLTKSFVGPKNDSSLVLSSSIISMAIFSPTDQYLPVRSRVVVWS